MLTKKQWCEMVMANLVLAALAIPCLRAIGYVGIMENTPLIYRIFCSSLCAIACGFILKCMYCFTWNMTGLLYDKVIRIFSNFKKRS